MNSIKIDFFRGFIGLVMIFILSTNQIVEAKRSDEISLNGNHFMIEKVQKGNSEKITTCEDGALDYVQMLKDCRVHLASDNYDIIVVIEGISWFRCTTLQIAAFWQRNFG